MHRQGVQGSHQEYRVSHRRCRVPQSRRCRGEEVLGTADDRNRIIVVSNTTSCLLVNDLSKWNNCPVGRRLWQHWLCYSLSTGESSWNQANYSFHPAPFFVLDEVDAALDPTNVSKLARYVRDQAEKDVQFLIISLKSTL
jgi:predicted ATPase